MEVLSWVLAEREASAEYKARALKHGFHNFGAAGVFEQDDLELWASATQASDNPIAQRYPYSFHSSLPFDDAPLKDWKRPGRAYPAVEHRSRPARLHAPLGRGDAVAGPGMDGEYSSAPSDDAAFMEVLRFLHREAALLDRRDYPAWLGLLTADIRYAVTARVSRPGGTRAARLRHRRRGRGHAAAARAADFGREAHQGRKPAHADAPLRLHLEVEDAVSPNHHVAYSNLLVYRQRGTAPDGDFYAGRRRDVLRRVDGSLRVADRLVRLDHNVLFDGSLSVIL